MKRDDDDKHVQLGVKEKQDIAEQIEDELDIQSGETSINMSLGAMSLSIDSDADLDETVEAVERLWDGRIEEIKENESALKRDLTEEDNHPLFG